MKPIALVLSGCGVFDGTEIHEAVITMLRLAQKNAKFQCLAPNIEQMHVVNHLTGEASEESRNVLIESARIARGEVISLEDANPDDYSGLIIPGGFGAAKNLSDFAIKGAECSVTPSLQRFTQQIHTANKPIGLICITPALTPLLLGENALCTIGNDAETAAAITKMGGTHQDCSVGDITFDPQHKLVSTPAYMLAENIAEAAEGINKLVDKVLELV